jgi:hypothetical protein
MTQEEIKRANEIEDKIKYLQVKIDELCKLNETVQETNAKISIKTVVEAQYPNGHNHFVEIEDIPTERNTPILVFINNLYTKKRLLEIELNVLKA